MQPKILRTSKFFVMTNLTNLLYLFLSFLLFFLLLSFTSWFTFPKHHSNQYQHLQLNWRALSQLSFFFLSLDKFYQARNTKFESGGVEKNSWMSNVPYFSFFLFEQSRFSCFNFSFFVLGPCVEHSFFFF